MTKLTSKNMVSVKIDIRHGPVSPAARASWAKFWKRLVADANKREVSHE